MRKPRSTAPRARLEALAGAAAAALTLVVVAVAPAFAATRHVPSAFATFQAAIDAAAVGDTVLVAPGTYTGLGNRDVDFLGKDIVVRSSGGAAVTTLDIQASVASPHRGFFIASGETSAAVLDGFTIQNGYMGTMPGGAPPASARRAAPRAASARVALPHIAHDLSGGGIKCQASQPTLRNLVILNCGSEYTGGGLDFEVLAEPTVENCVVRGCYAGFEGGGITIETASFPIIRDCVVTGNVASRGAGIGCNADARIIGCLIAGNRAVQPDIGLSFGGGIAVVFPASLYLERTIVTDNCAPDGGGEIFVDNGASLSFACSVFDPDGIVVSGSGMVSYPSANLFAAPAFCFPLGCDAAPSTGGDYTLQAGSPGLEPSSPCGQRIGPYAQGCGAQSAIESTTWSRLKGIYRSAR
jgi:hypothetical protein